MLIGSCSASAPFENNKINGCDPHEVMGVDGKPMAEHPLWLIIAIGTLGSASLVLIAGFASFRRQTWPYLFITVAIAMLLIRSIVGFLSLGGPMSVETHHFLEHLTDVVAIALLFGAIYTARTGQDERASGSSTQKESSEE